MSATETVPLFGADALSATVPFSQNSEESEEPRVKKQLRWVSRQWLKSATTVAFGTALTLAFGPSLASSSTLYPSAISRDAHLGQVSAKLGALERLEDGWAGPGTAAIEPKVTTQAFAVFLSLVRPELPMPAVVPTPDGAVQLEWHTRRADAEIHIAGGSEVDVFIRDLSSGQMFEFLDIKTIQALEPAVQKLWSVI